MHGLALAAALCVNAAAADISFDGTGGGAALKDLLQGVEVEQPRLPEAPAAAGARVYDFKALYKSLGYPSPDFFGSAEEETQDLDSYTSKEDTFYSEINGYLRYYPKPYDWSGTGPDAARVIVEHIDSIFGRVPVLPADLVLFRGLGLGYRDGRPFGIGEEFLDKGYVSTSAAFRVAYHFAVEMAADEEKPSRRAIFVMYLARPGEKGILIDQGEDEIILKHGRRFRVMARKDGVRKYDLYLVQACGAVCDRTLRQDVNAMWTSFSAPD